MQYVFPAMQQKARFGNRYMVPIGAYLAETSMVKRQITPSRCTLSDEKSPTGSVNQSPRGPANLPVGLSGREGKRCTILK